MFVSGKTYDVTLIKNGSEQTGVGWRAAQTGKGSLVTFDTPQGEVIINTASDHFISAKLSEQQQPPDESPLLLVLPYR